MSTMTVGGWFAAARTLPTDERSDLADALSDTFDDVDLSVPIPEAVEAEIDRRVTVCRADRMTAALPPATRDVRSLLEAARPMPWADRLVLFRALHQESMAEVGLYPLPEWLKAELDRRIADAEAHPERCVPWEVVEARIRAKYKGELDDEP